MERKTVIGFIIKNWPRLIPGPAGNVLKKMIY
jgi:hypothetical protein